MSTYKLFRPNDSVTPLYVIKLDENLLIPMDEENRDYQVYLKWVADGNTPLLPDSAYAPTEPPQ